jgi:acetyltransferase-like isoleucine patch superfamily enzyme
MMIKTNDYEISPSAIVKTSEIGENSKIWEFANLYGCFIGCDCNIGSYVEIQKDARIGNNVVISSHSFICSLVTIEDDVFIGHGVMTINDVNPPSFRRTGSKEYWKQTLIKKGAVIGSNSTIFPVCIGENAIVGAGAVVLQDVPDGCVVVGNPAQIVSKDKFYKDKL